MAKLTVERSIWIAAPRERVWQAVTEPAHLEQWYAVGCPWEIPALEAGATVKFHNTSTEILSASIEVVDPPCQLTLRWAPEPDGTLIVTSFLLANENGGTRMTVTESGYDSMPEGERHKRADETGAGYAMSIENLKAYVEGLVAGLSETRQAAA
jgi:uncharacterized protein YndB with AHSA1/START domain